ncbi:MAG: dockerin type I repeat-containing protein [bacterium]|nr:dockerin type I repeat-containing protein [bacterium]
MKTNKNLLAAILVISIFALTPAATTKAVSVKDLVSKLYLIQKQLDALSQQASSYYAQQAAVVQKAQEEAVEKAKQTSAGDGKTTVQENSESVEKKSDTGEEKTTIDYGEVARLQNMVDLGYQNWRLVPGLVLKNEGLNYRFLKEELETAKQISYFSNIGVAKYSAIHDSKMWTITLIQPTIGVGKIWTVSETKITDDLKTAPCGNYGDLNNDKFLTQEDADILLNYIYLGGSLTNEQTINGDINNDGKIDLFDSIYLKKFLDGKVSKFPVCFGDFSVVLPEEKETLINGSSYTIKWTIPKGVESYLIDFSIKDSKKEYPVDKIYVNPFSEYDENGVIVIGYNWQIKEKIGTDYKIKLDVKNFDDEVLLTAESKKSFKIENISSDKKFPPCGNYGDLTYNGYIDFLDAALIRNYVKKIGYLSQKQKGISDLNNNGRIDAGDANVIDFYLQGKISSFLTCSSKTTKLDLSVEKVSFSDEGMAVIELKNSASVKIGNNEIITGWIYKDNIFAKEFSVTGIDFSKSGKATIQENIGEVAEKILVLIDPLNSIAEESENNNYFVFEKKTTK